MALRTAGQAVRFLQHREVGDMSESKKPNNLKTGLMLGGVALFFFLSVIVKQVWFR